MKKSAWAALAAVGASVGSTRAKAKPGHVECSPTHRDFSISIFSKNLHWLGYDQMADTAAEMGFEGVDLTVRPGGHVEPERVREDLPRAVAAVRKAGLEVYMITTALQSALSPFAESILATAGQLGIPFYRMGWMNYDEQLDIGSNLQRFKQNLEELAVLNSRHHICGDYQNHSGASFGSPVWDLARMLEGFDPRHVGSQYDILHATVEGANSWPLGLQALNQYVHTIDIKDFRWKQDGRKAQSEVVPMGEGVVDFPKFFELLKKLQIRAPFSMHFEYPLGGAESGDRSIRIKPQEVTSAMTRDLMTFRGMLKDSGLI